MNKPFKPEYSNISWDYSDKLFQAWSTGKTGYPFIDAAIRQLLYTGYMHNRPRMAVASFLAKDLLLDWRLGEQFFMLHLIDGDFASNNGGWGFSASIGVDPQPYFRIFNPISQSERFDEDGEYIRKWVPELKGIMGKEVHDPYGRGKGAEAKRSGYPEMVVEHSGARKRALEVYKEGLGRSTA
jgi:deoxyribodipyrimidine photo-lyase